MSNSVYAKLWTDTQRRLGAVIPQDHALQAAEPTKNKRLAYSLVAHMYVLYISLVKDLDQCYDQMLQPQKRPLVRRLLDMCIGRVLELKQELVTLDLCDYNYIDNVLFEMKLTPFDIETPPLKFYLLERAQELAERRRAMDEILESLSVSSLEEANPVPEPPPPPAMTRAEAVRLIQRHERARQGRLQAVIWQDVFHIKLKVAQGIRLTKLDDKGVDRAVRLIQRIWRGHSARNKVKHRLTREALLLGMATPSWMPTYAQARAEEVCRLRRALQAEHQKEYEEANVREKAKFMKIKGPGLMEDYTDELREWFIEWYNKAYRFPDFPTEEEGGSLKVINHDVMTPEEYLDLVEEKRKEREKNQLDKGRAKREMEKKKQKEKEMKKRERAKEEEQKRKEKERIKEGKEDDEGFKVKTSKFVPQLDNANAEYIGVWRDKDESNNEAQKFDLPMVQDAKKNECESEIRKVVDNMMRIELEVLNAALERDRIKRLGKKGKNKKKKNKKKKGNKGKKGKKKKDLTGDRTTDSLFEELVTNGIIKRYPEVYIKDFIAEFSYSNYEYRRMERDPIPSLGEVKQVIMEYCILPMGSNIVHQLAPLTRSVCIVGPAGCGKHMLVHAICTELGAVMFDLTPANIAGKYPGKEGLQMLVHLVDKMSKILQPSILFIDGAEKPFYKKIPKPERMTDPRRLKKQLGKLVKAINPEDQVMLVGITKAPWNARPPMVKLYNRFILLPQADYGTVERAWNQLLMKYHGVDRDFPTSALATETRGYSLGDMTRFVQGHMTVERILSLPKEPLSAKELLNGMMQLPQVTAQEHDKLVQWFRKKTPLAKHRTIVLEKEAELREQMAKLKKGKRGG